MGRVWDWRADLAASRDLSAAQRDRHAFVLGWFEGWRTRGGHAPSVESARAFWREQVLAKPRDTWQLDQWTDGIRWYLRWLENCQRDGGDARTVPERIRHAVRMAGARRGLALRTRKTYSGWAARFGAWAGTAERALDEGVARDFLTHIVADERVAYSTQKQALNALVFFFRDVCGREEVDLQVRLRKTQRSLPVVLECREVVSILERLEGVVQTALERSVPPARSCWQWLRFQLFAKGAPLSKLPRRSSPTSECDSPERRPPTRTRPSYSISSNGNFAQMDHGFPTDVRRQLPMAYGL